MVRIAARLNRLRLWLPAVAILLVGWLVFWVAQGFVTACNLVGPCPGPGARVGPALLFGALMLLPLAAVIIASLLRTPAEGMVKFAYFALIAVAAVGYGVICFSAGFTVGIPFLLCALALCGTVAIAHFGVLALKAEQTRR